MLINLIVFKDIAVSGNWSTANDHLFPVSVCSCEDYVTVTCTGCGSSESCGVVPTDDLYSLEEGGC